MLLPKNIDIIITIVGRFYGLGFATYRTVRHRTVLYCIVLYGTVREQSQTNIQYVARVKVNKNLEICGTRSSDNLPFNMITRLEVHHVLSNDVTIPLPTNMPRTSSGVGTSPSNIMTKPAWFDHHLVLNTKIIAAQSGVQLRSTTYSLRAKVVRLVNGWRQDMLASGSENGVHADRAALWRSSPYGKLWLSGDFTAPIRPFTPCLARGNSNKASTETKYE